MVVGITSHLWKYKTLVQSNHSHLSRCNFLSLLLAEDFPGAGYEQDERGAKKWFVFVFFLNDPYGMQVQVSFQITGKS